MLPPWANEPIVIVEHDADSLARGAAECARVAEILGTREVEHIGSTAVPDLAAKPIVDIMARVDSLDLPSATMETLARDGWHHVPPDLDGRDWRKFFVKISQGARIAHLHVLDGSSPRWEKQLAFRDRLRESPRLVADYSALKRMLAEQHRDDREGYTEAKTDFIERVLAGMAKRRWSAVDGARGSCGTRLRRHRRRGRDRRDRLSRDSQSRELVGPACEPRASLVSHLSRSKSARQDGCTRDAHRSRVSSRHAGRSPVTPPPTANFDRLG